MFEYSIASSAIIRGFSAGMIRRKRSASVSCYKPMPLSHDIACHLSIHRHDLPAGAGRFATEAMLHLAVIDKERTNVCKRIYKKKRVFAGRAGRKVFSEVPGLRCAIDLHTPS